MSGEKVNIAIIVAVSNYSADASPLPGSAQDGEAIEVLVRNSGHFSEVLSLTSEAKSIVVKPQLVEFLKKFKDTQIGDIFFYFSGHGDFSGEEFYYLLADYENRRRNQTTLTNSELDDLIRALEPAVFIKVVDACHSGVAYIKSSEELDGYLKGTQAKFKRLYFMFSSQSDQSSYQDRALSYFTRSFIEAITNHEGAAIRYKDIMDFISDDFEDNARQRPFFVIQADLTELFFEVTEQARSSLASFLPQVTVVEQVPSIAEKKPSLVALITEDAKSYCTKEEATEAITFLSKLIHEQSISPDLADLFTQRTEEIKNRRPPGSVAIGHWFEQGKEEKRYFVEVTKEMRSETRRVPKRFSIAGYNILTGRQDSDYETVTSARPVVTGYRSTVDLPFEYLEIYVDPKFPNLNAAACYVVPTISMTHLRVFWTFAQFERITWDEQRMASDFEWKTEAFPIRSTEAMEGLVVSIVADFSSFIEKPIKERWVPPTAAESQQQ